MIGNFRNLVILVDMGDIGFHYQIDYEWMRIKERNTKIERILQKAQRRDFRRPNAKIDVKVEWLMILMFNMLEFVMINMIDM